MSRILIIGGTGNISSGITNLLLEKGGHEIFHLNRGLKQKEVTGVTTLLADRKDAKAFQHVVESAGNFDCVIDMICYRPDEANQAIELFRGKTDQYILCSSAEVYDRRNVSYPIHEDQPLGWLNSDYEFGLGKVLCEQLFDQAEEEDFNVTTFRPATTYSEGTPLVHLFGWDTYFIDRIRKNKPIIAHGDGTTVMVAAHRDDVASAFVNAIGNPVAFGKKYNVTGMEMMTWVQYYSLLAWSNGYSDPAFVYIPSREILKLEPEKAYPLNVNYRFNDIYDNSEAIKDLDFKYTIDWLEGSARCITWLEENRQMKDCADFPFYDSIIDRWNRMLGLPSF